MSSPLQILLPLALSYSEELAESGVVRLYGLALDIFLQVQSATILLRDFSIPDNDVPDLS